MTEAKKEPSIRGDLMAITKARLSAMVLVTTFVGYWLCSRIQGFDWALMLHTLFGTALAALGSSVFNQLMEVEADRKMRRKNVMVQVRGWGTIGVVVLSACAVSLFLGGKKMQR